MNPPTGSTLRCLARGLALALGAVAATLQAAEPSPLPLWIWADHATNAPPETVYLRHRFVTPHLNWRATLTVAGGEPASIFLNGDLIARTTAWDQPVRGEISVKLRQGTNLLAIQATRSGGPAGIVARIDLGGVGGERTILSGAHWQASRREEPGWKLDGFDSRRWPAAMVLGRLGDAPWGNPFSRPVATPAADIQVPPGFEVDLLRSAAPGEGSWICLAADPKGRLWISPQGDGTPLLRVTLDAAGNVGAVERMDVPLHYAMGLLFAHDSLYVNGRGPNGAGLHRLIDTNHNDRFEPDEVRLLQDFRGEGGEHGYHAVALGPDDFIYVLNGNSTQPPFNLSPHSPYQAYSGDAIGALLEDPETAHHGLGTPAGHILRTDPEGRTWTLWAGGLRNAYDFAFNPEGELFTFDSDMEWDWGAPWYRPTRILHCVPGADFGWRSGVHWWPEDHPDTLPAVARVGIGSPTGVKFGTRSHFPERYRRVLFVQDWSYGRILAVHLQPRGASYTATVEPFLRGRPLNLTSLDFGSDGALYFVTGGRGTQSGLYRVRATRDRTDPRQLPPSPADPAAAKARAVRFDLESRIHAPRPADLAVIWPHLGMAESQAPTNAIASATNRVSQPDPYIRHAARIALEHLPVPIWEEAALKEPDPAIALPALLALARRGGPDHQTLILEALTRFTIDSLPPDDQRLALRIVEVSLFRHGRPGHDVTAPLLAQLAPLYPARQWPMNRELSRVLPALDAPHLLAPTLQLFRSAPTQEEQIHYLSLLRLSPEPWSDAQLEAVLSWWQIPRSSLSHPAELHRWFGDVGRTYSEGAQLHLKLEGWRGRFVSRLSPETWQRFAALLAPSPAPDAPPPPAPRPFVREWMLAELAPSFDSPLRHRDFERGRKAYIDAQCALCHRIENFGGAIGPELSGAGAKYTARDLLEAILEPSRVVSEQYQDTTVTLDSGEEITGRIVAEEGDSLVLLVNPLRPVERRLNRKSVTARATARLSPMPEGLANVLSRDDLLDLVAYLLSGANRNDPVFQSAPPSR